MVNPVIKIVAEDAAGKELCEFKNAQNISFTRFLSSAGEMVFTIPHTDVNFALITGMRTHLKLVRGGVVVWKGIYDYMREDENNYTIFASTYESLLSYYLIAPTAPTTSTVRKFAGKKLGTEVAKILFDEAVAKSGSLLTGFTDGTIENPYTDGTSTEMTSNFEFNYDKLSDALKTISEGGGADFEITFAKAFNFYRRKGSDKASVVFHLEDSGPGNISSFKRDVDFRAIGNNLYAFGVGIGANFLKGNIADVTSQGTYGLMERSLGTPKVLVDQSTLDKLVTDQLKTAKDPFQLISPNITVNGVGFFSGWDIGDNVVVTLNFGETNISEYRRILGVNVSYSYTGAESVYLFLGIKRT